MRAPRRPRRGRPTDRCRTHVFIAASVGDCPHARSRCGPISKNEPRRSAKHPGRGGHEAQGRAESDARADPRIRPGRRREVFRPSRTGRRRGGRPRGAFPFAPEPAVPPWRGGDRPCTCAGYWGRKPNVPHAKGLRAKDSHPPPDVHLRRGAKTSLKTFRGRAYGCPRIQHASPQAPRSTPARATNDTPEKSG